MRALAFLNNLGVFQRVVVFHLFFAEPAVPEDPAHREHV